MRTEAEARQLACWVSMAAPASRERDRRGVRMCKASGCFAWVWGPKFVIKSFPDGPPDDTWEKVVGYAQQYRQPAPPEEWRGDCAALPPDLVCGANQ